MYSIVIAIFFLIIGVWLLLHEMGKPAPERNRWTVLSSILSFFLAVLVAFSWALFVFY